MKLFSIKLRDADSNKLNKLVKRSKKSVLVNKSQIVRYAIAKLDLSDDDFEKVAKM